MPVTFAQMGFSDAVTACSATPDTDGYVGSFSGLPYHIHPTATPDAFAALQAAIAASEVTVTAYASVAPTTAQLLAYANGHQWALAAGGYTITIAGTALVWATDDVSQGLITGKAVRLMQAGAPTSVNWQFATGFVALTATEFTAAAIQIADFVQSTFAALQPIIASILAGTITTYAAIDAASWPSNVSATAIS